MNESELASTEFLEELKLAKGKVGFWYRCLKILGESSFFSFGIFGLHGEMEWSSFDHEYYDGLGGLQKFLKSQFQIDYCPPELKAEWERPGIVRGIFGAIKYQRARELPFIKWKERDFSKGVTFSKPLKEVYTISLSPDESKQFLSQLKIKGFNINAYLMRELTTFLKQEFLSEKVKNCLWMFPVNMRGHVPEIEGDFNRSSYVDVVVAENDTPESIRSKMVSKFNDKEHWYVWYGAKLIPRLFGGQAFETVKQHLISGGPPYLGNFSNLGSYTFPGKINSPIFLAVAATRVRPISLGILSVNGYLTITFQFHETLSVTSDFSDKLNNFKKSLLAV